MHYTDHDIQDNDQDKDMQLPFKSHNDCASNSFTPLPVNPETMVFSLTSVITEKIETYKRINFQSSFLSSIWQPPKSC
jgi:hypothetical protein